MRSQIRALVVGGSPADRRSVEEALIDGGEFQLYFPRHYEELLEQLKSEQFQIMLVGRDVSGEDPRQLIMSLRHIAPSIPVIVFGGAENEELKVTFTELGAQDWLSSQKLKAEFLQRAVLRAVERAKPALPAVADIEAAAGSTLIENSYDGVFAYDLQFRYVVWNQIMERIFGLSKNEAIGRYAPEVLPCLNDIDEDEIFVAVRSGRSITPPERPYVVPRTKRSGIFESKYVPMRNATGQIVGVLGIFRDTTDIGQSERELRESEERFRRMADVVPSLVWMSTRDGQRTFFNKRWLEFTGRQMDDITGSSYVQNIHPQDAQRFVQTCTRAIAAKQDFNVEYRIRRKDGQYRRILDTGSPLIASDGRLIGYVGLCADVSETRATHQSMETAMPRPIPDRTPNTVENAPIGIWKLDPHFMITKVNPTVVKQLGLGSEDMVGRSFFSIVGSLSPATFKSVLERGERIHLENQMISRSDSPDRSPTYWDVAAWPLKGEREEIVGVCVSTMEVTERQRLMQQREDFVATLVHDLKTPLIGADKTLETLMAGALGVLDAGQNDVLAMLRRSNQQLLMMVQNLIEFYRFDTSQSLSSFEPINLPDLIHSCASELSALAEQRGVALHVNLKGQLGPIMADKLAIRRVFANLLDNALKFTPRGGQVEVTGERMRHEVAIHVKDTGIGIPLAEQGKLFQRFWQGERGKRFAVGTGLGLYLCREIVTSHKGTISVTSRENEGATFTVILPTADKRA
ncbi:MAG TPA: PAS domain S-box protein [Candidatus Obscuribacterales bacterium]